MKVLYKILLAAAVTLVGFFLAASGSIVGAIVKYVGLCFLLIVLINWLNSTNRKK